MFSSNALAGKYGQSDCSRHDLSAPEPARPRIVESSSGCRESEKLFEGFERDLLGSNSIPARIAALVGEANQLVASYKAAAAASTDQQRAQETVRALSRQMEAKRALLAELGEELVAVKKKAEADSKKTSGILAKLTAPLPQMRSDISSYQRGEKELTAQIERMDRELAAAVEPQRSRITGKIGEYQSRREKVRHDSERLKKAVLALENARKDMDQNQDAYGKIIAVLGRSANEYLVAHRSLDQSILDSKSRDSKMASLSSEKAGGDSGKQEAGEAKAAAAGSSPQISPDEAKLLRDTRKSDAGQALAAVHGDQSKKLAEGAVEQRLYRGDIVDAVATEKKAGAMEAVQRRAAEVADESITKTAAEQARDFVERQNGPDGALRALVGDPKNGTPGMEAARRPFTQEERDRLPWYARLFDPYAAKDQAAAQERYREYNQDFQKLSPTAQRMVTDLGLPAELSDSKMYVRNVTENVPIDQNETYDDPRLQACQSAGQATCQVRSMRFHDDGKLATARHGLRDLEAFRQAHVESSRDDMLRANLLVQGNNEETRRDMGVVQRITSLTTKSIDEDVSDVRAAEARAAAAGTPAVKAEESEVLGGVKFAQHFRNRAALEANRIQAEAAWDRSGFLTDAAPHAGAVVAHDPARAKELGDALHVPYANNNAMLLHERADFARELMLGGTGTLMGQMAVNQDSDRKLAGSVVAADQYRVPMLLDKAARDRSDYNWNVYAFTPLAVATGPTELMGVGMATRAARGVGTGVRAAETVESGAEMAMQVYAARGSDQFAAPVVRSIDDAPIAPAARAPQMVDPPEGVRSAPVATGAIDDAPTVTSGRLSQNVDPPEGAASAPTSAPVAARSAGDAPLSIGTPTRDVMPAPRRIPKGQVTEAMQERARDLVESYRPRYWEPNPNLRGGVRERKAAFQPGQEQRITSGAAEVRRLEAEVQSLARQLPQKGSPPEALAGEIESASRRLAEAQKSVYDELGFHNTRIAMRGGSQEPARWVLETIPGEVHAAVPNRRLAEMVRKSEGNLRVVLDPVGLMHNFNGADGAFVKGKGKAKFDGEVLLPALDAMGPRLDVRPVIPHEKKHATNFYRAHSSDYRAYVEATERRKNPDLSDAQIAERVNQRIQSHQIGSMETQFSSNWLSNSSYYNYMSMDEVDAGLLDLKLSTRLHDDAVFVRDVLGEGAMPVTLREHLMTPKDGWAAPGRLSTGVEEQLIGRNIAAFTDRQALTQHAFPHAERVVDDAIKALDENRILTSEPTNRGAVTMSWGDGFNNLIFERLDPSEGQGILVKVPIKADTSSFEASLRVRLVGVSDLNSPEALQRLRQEVIREKERLARLPASVNAPVAETASRTATPSGGLWQKFKGWLDGKAAKDAPVAEGVVEGTDGSARTAARPVSRNPARDGGAEPVVRSTDEAPIADPHSNAAEVSAPAAVPENKTFLQRAAETPDAHPPNEYTFTKPVSMRIQEIKKHAAESGNPISNQEARKLALNGIDPKMHRFYHPETGRFSYKQGGGVPRILASESGGQPLKALRINYVPATKKMGHLDGSIFDELFKDYAGPKGVMSVIPDVELWIMASTERLDELRAMVAGIPDPSVRNRVKIYSHDGMITHWAQDGSKPLVHGEATLVQVEGVKTTGYGYGSLTKALGPDVETPVSKLAFEGGNVVVGERHAFVGSDIVQHQMDNLAITRAEAIEALSEEFGRPVVEMGFVTAGKSMDQAHFHIDLDMAVARDWNAARAGQHKEKVLLQDPESFFRLYGINDVGKMDQAAFDVARQKAIAEIAANPGASSVEKTVAALLKDADLEKIKAEIDQMGYYRTLLRKQGYEVESLPGTGIGSRMRHMGSSNSANDPFQFYNYTNVVFSRNKAVVPELGIPRLDQAAHRVFKNLGYEVVPVKSPRGSICIDGGVRCMTETFRHAYVTRTAAPARPAAREIGNYKTVSQQLGELKRTMMGKLRSEKGLLKKALKGVDERFHKFYDPKTGAFRYTPDPNVPRALASESGSQPLMAAHVNFVPTSKARIPALLQAGVFDTFLDDFVGTAARPGAMAKLPEMELWITSTKATEKQVRKLVEGVADASIRNRIRVLPHQEQSPWWQRLMGHKIINSYWMQDGAKPLAHGPASVVQRDGVKVLGRQEYRVSTEALRPYGVDVSRSLFDFEGGNIIVGERNVFVGADIVEHTMKQLRITRTEAKQALSAEFGAPVVEMGYQHPSKAMKQNSFHIDLDMAVARDWNGATTGVAREVVLLQSPASLFDIHGISGLSNLGEAEFNRLKLAAAAKIEGNPAATPMEKTVAAFFRKVSYEEITAEQKMLDQYRRGLEAEGYLVQAIPGTSTPSGWRQMLHRQSENDPFPFYNYTNVILSGRQALIPELGIPALDRAAQETYRRLGYEVILMRAPVGSLCLQGGARCMTQTFRNPYVLRTLQAPATR